MPWLLAMALAGPAWAGEQPSVRVQWDGASAGYSLKAERATTEAICRELERVSRCKVELDKKLGSQVLTLDLSARPAERLFMVLARRLPARMGVGYRMRPTSLAGRGSEVFARELISLELGPVPVSEAVRRLGIAVRLDDVQGNVRITAARHPLHQVLDSIAKQVRGEWETVVRLDPLKFPDAEAAEDDRMRGHFSDLSRLPPVERRDEIRDAFKDLEALAPVERNRALARAAQDVRSLGTLLERVPGEHRGIIGPRILGVARDYATVLGRLPVEKRGLYGPVWGALHELETQLSQIR
jgi:hypothetical protein